MHLISDGVSWSRRHYWQAVLMLSVGLSLLLGGLVFVLAALTARTGRWSCSPVTAGAAAAISSTAALVVLLLFSRAIEVPPEYE